MIIESLLDTDLYKFTMMQVVLHHFPGAIVEYAFKCRSPAVDLTPYAEEIREEIKAFCQLRLQPDELRYLQSLPYLKDDFVEFLKIFQANAEFIEIKTDPAFELRIKGPWLHTILFEVPVLAIISEIYFKHHRRGDELAVGQAHLNAKIETVKASAGDDFQFSDFGTRRRYSRQWHQVVMETLTQALPEHMRGTSNVWLARHCNVKPIGTMAHEYIQACQSLGPRLRNSQKFAFEKWAQEYRGDLGIALSDTYSTDAFLKDFDLYFCKLFDGARQDSGDPFAWAEAIIAHYEKYHIDPRSKTLVFSDSLTFEKALAIWERFHTQARLAFGIGTNLTNDVGHKPLDMVIKMTRCNDQPVAKISEAPGKSMCQDESYFNYLKQVFKIK